ncbi:MAG: restriction endonuclease [Acidobacteria bacterium]|nr:restriction endonuclease [Acidobacteriota bacterium]
MPSPDRSMPTGAEFEYIVAEAFRKARWRVRRHPATGDMCADFIVGKGARQYVVEVKSAAEGRRDRLIPLLAQAILQAQSFARQLPERAAPLAVVAARRVPASVAEHLKRFAARYAPDVAVGIVDAEGLRSFVGPGLEGLEAKPSSHTKRRTAPRQRLPDLFSDLNQWMLKIVLGQDLPERLISIPREPIRNASELARAADVTIMSASRFLKKLADEGFLDEYSETLRIVRVDELLERWALESRKTWRDLPARWIIKQDVKRLFAGVARYAAESKAELPSKSRLSPERTLKPQPRLCVGLLAAADALDIGFVRGASPHLYLERLDFDVLHQLGLTVEDSVHRSDVYIRIPSNKEAIFRPCVPRHGLPVSDVVQIWLDASTHPTRGREQADEIRRRVLKPLFGKRP